MAEVRKNRHQSHRRGSEWMKEGGNESLDVDYDDYAGSIGSLSCRIVIKALNCRDPNEIPAA